MDKPVTRTGRTEPLRIHKQLIIWLLLEHPEDLIPDGPYKTAAEAIAALEAHPSTWIVNGVLSADESDSEVQP